MATATSKTSGASSASARLDGPIRCLIVTPERTVLDQGTDFVSVPLFDGELGVLPGRAPLVGRLGFGELRTRNGDTIRRVYVDSGFVQIRDDVITILTSRAVPADELAVEEATERLNRARSRKAVGDAAIEERHREVDRARAMLRAAEHARG